MNFTCFNLRGRPLSSSDGKLSFASVAAEKKKTQLAITTIQVNWSGNVLNISVH